MGLVLWSAAYLVSKGIETGRLEAEHLLAEALGVERLQLYLEFDRPLVSQELAAFKPLLKRRAQREPLQYILGRTAFREIELTTDTRALIPRPETEQLVELVLDHTRPANGGLTAVDIGTGTGAIALSLLHEGAFERVVATDVSEQALSLARENANRNEVGDRVDFRLGATWQPIRPGERFDVIVSNPPYITTQEMTELQPEVGEWEPVQALDAGKDGLEVLRPLLAGAVEHLRPGGRLFVEIGAGQGPLIVALAGETIGLTDAVVRRDLAGKKRFFLARVVPQGDSSSEPRGS
jgi:release factor glutamine methyltransferase